MAIITGDDNFTSKLNQALSASPVGIVEFVSALNIFLSITASLGNTLILIALHKVSSIYPPTKLFSRCLAVTDLCVGLVVQPLSTFNILSRITKMNSSVILHVQSYGHACGWMLCTVSVLTSTAISVDRLLALLLGLRYRHVVTLRRVRVVIICLWIIGAFHGLIQIWRRNIAEMEVSVVIILSLAISMFCYTRIHFKIRHNQAKIHDSVSHGQPNGRGIPPNISRYRKTVSNIFWVQLALTTCYVPFVIVAVLDANGIENGAAWIATEILVYINSSINPILYCWKIRAVRQAVKDTIRQLYCCNIYGGPRGPF